MFTRAPPNPYEEQVAKTTDENLLGENWEFILNLCDKVQEDGEEGARNVMAAVVKRLTHRNPNVQLYTLSLVEALSKNCGIEMHREIASKVFTQALEKVIIDRNTHEKVKRRALSLVAMWTAEFKSDINLGLMEELYKNLAAKNYKFETPEEPAPVKVDDEIRRKEEEELQRVLEMSMMDKGGRTQYQAGYADPSETQASGSGSSLPGQRGPASQWTQTHYPSSSPPASIASATVPAKPQPPSSQDVSRVRALHKFEPTEKGELAFEKGDIIKVVDRNYKDWWRGQLKGRTGIFPVNYVEFLPDPTPAEIAKEAEQEAWVFAQAPKVDTLLGLLRSFDNAQNNIADDDEIQDLYRLCMELRPKVVKLLDKYNQKIAELHLMNDGFVKALNMYEGMLEESVTRRTAMYDARPEYAQAPAQARPMSVAYGAPGPGYAPMPTASYGSYQQPAPGYSAPNNGTYAAAQQAPQPYVDQNVIYGQQQTPYPQTQPVQPVSNPYTQPMQMQMPTTYAQSPQPVPQALPHSQARFQSQAPVRPQSQTQTRPQSQMMPQAHTMPQSQSYMMPQSQPQSQPQTMPQAQAQAQAQLQMPLQQEIKPDVVRQSVYQQPQAQASLQRQATKRATLGQVNGQLPRQITEGPPYIFDPTAIYPDANAQAWAQYYAQGGKDPQGAVYFISVPGLTDTRSQAPPMGSHIQNQTPSQTIQSQLIQPQQQSPQGEGGASLYGQAAPDYNHGAQQANEELLILPDGYSFSQTGSTSSLPSTGYGGQNGDQNGAPAIQSPVASSPQGNQQFYSMMSPGSPQQAHPHSMPSGYSGGNGDGAYFSQHAASGQASPPASGPALDALYGSPQQPYQQQGQHQPFAQMHAQFDGLGIDDRSGSAGVTAGQT